MNEVDLEFILEVARFGWNVAAIRYRMHFDAHWQGW